MVKLHSLWSAIRAVWSRTHSRVETAVSRGKQLSARAKSGVVVGTTRPDVAIMVIPGLFFALLGAMVLVAPGLMLGLISAFFLFVGALFCFAAYKYVQVRKRLEKSLRGVQAQVLVSRPQGMGGFFQGNHPESESSVEEQALEAAEVNLTEASHAELEEFMSQLAASTEGDMTDSQRRRVARMLREFEVKKIILH